MHQELTFKAFCHRICDGLYEPKISDDGQCTGYKLLLKMVAENITPASKEEFIRWREKPTFEELTSIPDIKYLTFLHVNLRPLIIDYWDKIKQLK